MQSPLLPAVLVQVRSSAAPAAPEQTATVTNAEKMEGFMLPLPCVKKKSRRISPGALVYFIVDNVFIFFGLVLLACFACFVIVFFIESRVILLGVRLKVDI